MRWRSLDVWARDGLGALVFAAIALVPALSPYGVVLGGLPERAPDSWHVLLLLGQALPLAARRVAPGAVLGIIAAAFAIHQLLAYPPSPAGLGLFFALFSAGAYQQNRRRLTLSLAVGVYVALAITLVHLGSTEQVWEWVAFAAVPSAAWGLGEVVRMRTIAAHDREIASAKSAVMEERARVARELHDIIGHHVTGIVVQAEAATFLLPPGETRMHQKFATIAASGRAALEELRQQLDLLDGTTPSMTPAIASLSDLVAAGRATGLQIELTEVGSPHGSGQLRLAVQRIVQEGLTNARKHAPGATVIVHTNWATPVVEVRIVSAAATTTHKVPGNDALFRSSAPGNGRGLAGLTERVSLLGGTLNAGPNSDGGFTIEARLPLTGAQAVAAKTSTRSTSA